MIEPVAFAAVLRWFAALLGIVAPIAAGTAAGAQDRPGGLDADTSTVVVVAPETYSAEVTVSYEFTNSSADIEFGSFLESIPAGAEVVSATMNSNEVQVFAAEPDERYRSIRVAFDQPLSPGEALKGEIVYTAVFQGDIEALSHVSPGLIAIDPYAVAQGSGSGRLEVRIPQAFTVVHVDGWELAGGSGDADGDVAVLTATDPQPYVHMKLVAEREDALVRRRISVRSIDLTVATPNTPTPETLAEIERAAELVADWTRLSTERSIEIRHSWTDGQTIRRLPDPDRTVAVVLPTAGVGSYAAVVASEVLASIDWADEALLLDTAWALGTTAANAAGPAAGEPDGNGADRTATGDVASAATDATSQPSAGKWVAPITAALSAMNAESARNVFAGLAGGNITYPGEVVVARTDPVDWRILLDALENQGAPSAAAGFAEAGGSGAASETIWRAAARRDYADLDELANGWSMPPYLRIPLAAWEFGKFETLHHTVSELLVARDELAAAAAEQDLAMGVYLRQAFESAETSMDDAWGLLDEQRGALDVVAEAYTLATTDRGVLARIGMVGRDPGSHRDRILQLWDAGGFAESAFQAKMLIDTYEGAVGRGTLRVVIPLSAIVALAALARWVLGRRRRTGRKRPRFLLGEPSRPDRTTDESPGGPVRSLDQNV